CAFSMTEAAVASDLLQPADAGSFEDAKVKEESDEDAPAEVSSKVGAICSDNDVKEFDDDEDSVRMAKMKAEEAARRAASNKCDVCGENEKKYRCPKCDSRSCSLACSKKHKEDDNCDGVRGPWQPVAKISRLNEQRVNEDARFLNQVVTGVRSTLAPKQEKAEQNAAAVPATPLVEGGETPATAPEAQGEEGDIQIPQPTFAPIPECLSEGLREQAACQSERFLIGACHKRRVFIYFNDNKMTEDASRHEQYSDTVFWAVTLEFRKEIRGEDGVGTGSFSSYEYTVQQVPESIHVRTIIKQFLRPRLHGPLVSKDQLDMDKLQPFIDATAEKINLFMPSWLRGEDKYYTVNSEATFLDNLRQRVVVNHPKIVLCLQSEFLSLEIITEEEQRMVAEARKVIREGRAGAYPRGGRGGGDRGGGFRGNHRGGPGGFHQHGGRGGGFGFGGGGRGRGGGGFHGGNKRPFDGGDRGGYGKRGRGDGGRGRGGGRQPYRNRELDDFDPFEPFSGPSGAAMLESWNASVHKPEPEPSNEEQKPKNYFPDLDSM
ncbi:hypothetical protein PFISCL1PPCAC_2172, partial [Pristionchus fissidentatus]